MGHKFVKALKESGERDGWNEYACASQKYLNQLKPAWALEWQVWTIIPSVPIGFGYNLPIK